MTREEAIKMLTAKVECMTRDTSGMDEECNSHNCGGCHLCYEQGNMGEQIEYLHMAIKALEEPQWTLCSEKLPEKNGRYLVTRGLKACNSIWNRVYIINYSDLMGLKAGKIWWNGNVGKSDFQRIDDVVAWRYLPEPWKG